MLSVSSVVQYSTVENQRRILRYRDGEIEITDDHLALEQPLEIRVRNRSLVVTMRTPGHDQELAAGFLLGEGLIKARDDIASIEPCAFDRNGNTINITPAAHVAIDFEKLTRHVFASSSCGLCGKATIESIHRLFPPVKSQVNINAATLLELPEKLRSSQATFDQTGGLHAAGIFDASGNLLVSREDVGRHNAVDKVIGYCFLNGIALDDKILLVSGRASFEILQKSLAARIPIVAAISAPSSLAVDFANESDQTLVGFLRGGRMNIYSHPHRVNAKSS